RVQVRIDEQPSRVFAEPIVGIPPQPSKLGLPKTPNLIVLEEIACEISLGVISKDERKHEGGGRHRPLHLPNHFRILQVELRHDYFRRFLPKARYTRLPTTSAPRPSCTGLTFANKPLRAKATSPWPPLARTAPTNATKFG